MQQSLDLRYYVAVFWARFSLFLGIFTVVSVSFAAVALILPARYDATARIIVESQQIPDELARSTVTAVARERIGVIQQRIMTRDNLIDIAKRLKIFDPRLNLSSADIVDRMFESTTFEVISLGGTRRSAGATAFSVSFTADSGSKAASVANEYVSLILNENIKLRTDRASETLAFFELENDRLAQELTATERQIAEFKRINRNTLPESKDYHIGTLQRSADRLIGISREISEIAEARRAIEASRTDPRLYASGGNALAGMSNLERDLLELERLISSKSAILSSQHPEMKALNARYNKLQAAVEDERAAKIANPDSEEEVETQLTGTAAIVELELERQELALDLREKRLLEEKALLEEKIAESEAAINTIPNTEVALNNMMRRQDSLLTQYNEAVAKLSRAELGEQLEVKQQAERFELIESANAPPQPTSPNRLLILGMGVLLGFSGGFAAVFGLEFTSRTVRRPADLINKLDIEPIAIIPYIYTEAEKRKHVRNRWIWILLIISVISGSLWAVHTFHLPLDLLLQRVVDRLGIESIIGDVREALGMSR